MLRILLVVVFLSLSYSNEIKYKISFMGIHVADCVHSYHDTTIYNLNATKLNYSVKTKGLFNYLFKVDNNYEIIIDENTFKTLFYKKNTLQPRLKNKLNTSYINKEVIYPDNVVIADNEISIFGILHLININLFDKISSFDIIDREGKKYNFNIKNFGDTYAIKTNEIDLNDQGNIIDTDIFTWGLFLSNSNKYIYKNKEDDFINRCDFTKGLIKITAEIKNPN